jgi:hypothetical protein
MTTKTHPRLAARRGDRLVIHGHRLGEPARDAEILAALGPGGSPPFRVRWDDTGEETLLFPGSDAAVDHLERPRRPRRA